MANNPLTSFRPNHGCKATFIGFDFGTGKDQTAETTHVWVDGKPVLIRVDVYRDTIEATAVEITK